MIIADRETVRGTGSDPGSFGETFFAKRRHRRPDFRAGVADRVGVVKHDDIKVIGPAALGALRCRVLEIFSVAVRTAKLRIREAGIAFGPGALAIVDIVADHGDEAVGVAINAFEGFAEDLVALADTVDIRGEEGANALVIGLTRHFYPAVFLHALTKVHEATTAPGSECCFREIHGY